MFAGIQSFSSSLLCHTTTQETDAMAALRGGGVVLLNNNGCGHAAGSGLETNADKSEGGLNFQLQRQRRGLGIKSMHSLAQMRYCTIWGQFPREKWIWLGLWIMGRSFARERVGVKVGCFILWIIILLIWCSSQCAENKQFKKRGSLGVDTDNVCSRNVAALIYVLMKLPTTLITTAPTASSLTNHSNGRHSVSNIETPSHPSVVFVCFSHRAQGWENLMNPGDLFAKSGSVGRWPTVF